MIEFSTEHSKRLRPLGVLFTFQMPQQLFMRPFWVLLHNAGNKLAFLVAHGVNGTVRFCRIRIELESLFLLPLDVVHRAQSLGAPWALSEIARVPASAVSAPVLP
jgi:hypothetical protein